MDTYVPRHLRRSRTAAAAAVAVAVVTAAPANACDGADAQLSDAAPATLRSATVCLLNKRRRANGLSRLRGNRDLREAAQHYAQAMVDQGFFGHVSPAGAGLADRLRASGFISPAEAWFAGENLAWGVGSRATPHAIVRSWMRSPGHRANILQPAFHRVGIGVAAGAPQPVDGPAATYVGEFGD
jgi:uncharacterized protein YkwD